MRLWQVALGLTAGAVVLVYIGKRAAAKVAPAAATTAAPPGSPLPSQDDGSAELFVPIYTSGEPAGQTIIWTATDEQSKAVGPRYPSYYDADEDKFVFLDAGGAYHWTRLGADGSMTGTGSGTGAASVT